MEGRERCSFDSAQDRPTACDWLPIAVSPVGPNHRVGSKGRKRLVLCGLSTGASAPNQTESHVEQVVMDNESEGMYVPSWRTCLRTSPVPDRPWVLRPPGLRVQGWLEALPDKGRRQAPKRGRSQGHTIKRCMVSTRKETRRTCTVYKHSAKHTSLRQAPGPGERMNFGDGTAWLVKYTVVYYSTLC